MNLPIKAFAGSLAAVSVFAASAAAFAQGNPDNDGDRPAPTQDCLLAMANLSDVQLSHFDEMTAQHKARMQEHNAQMKEIAAITDDVERETAMQAMHEAMKDREPPVIPDDVQAAIDAVREACDRMGFGMHMGHGPGMMMGFGGPDGPMMGEGRHGKGHGMFMKMKHMDDDGSMSRGPFGDDDSAEESED